MNKRDKIKVEQGIKRLVDLSCKMIEEGNYTLAKKIGNESRAIYKLVTENLTRR